jgi:hypothetical protein
MKINQETLRRSTPNLRKLGVEIYLTGLFSELGRNDRLLEFREARLWTVETCCIIYNSLLK